jgi:hypothetical protein
MGCETERDPGQLVHKESHQGWIVGEMRVYVAEITFVYLAVRMNQPNQVSRHPETFKPGSRTVTLIQAVVDQDK